MNEVNTNINIAANLDHLLKSQELTKKDADRIFELSPGSTSKYTTGVTYPRIETMVAMAQYFQVSLDDFVYGNLGLENKKMDNFVKEKPPKSTINRKKSDIYVDKDHIIRVLQEHLKFMQDQLPQIIKDSLGEKLDYLYDIQMKKEILEKTQERQSILDAKKKTKIS